MTLTNYSVSFKSLGLVMLLISRPRQKFKSKSEKRRAALVALMGKRYLHLRLVACKIQADNLLQVCPKSTQRRKERV